MCCKSALWYCQSFICAGILDFFSGNVFIVYKPSILCRNNKQGVHVTSMYVEGIFKSACQFSKKWAEFKKTRGEKVLGVLITGWSVQGGECLYGWFRRGHAVCSALPQAGMPPSPWRSAVLSLVVQFLKVLSEGTWNWLIFAIIRK